MCVKKMIVSPKFRAAAFDWGRDGSDACGDAPAPIKGSEKSVARAQGGSCKEEQGNEDESAEACNDFEHIVANLRSGRARKTFCDRGQSRA